MGFSSSEAIVETCLIWGSANGSVHPFRMITRSGPKLHFFTKIASLGSTVATLQETAIALPQHSASFRWTIISPGVLHGTMTHSSVLPLTRVCSQARSLATPSVYWGPKASCTGYPKRLNAPSSCRFARRSASAFTGVPQCDRNEFAPNPMASPFDCPR